MMQPVDRIFYNGPHVKTMSKKNDEQKARSVDASSPEKFIRESPLTMGAGVVRLFARPIQRSVGWLIGLKTVPEGPRCHGNLG